MKKVLYFASSFGLPVLALAQTVTNVDSLFNLVMRVLNMVIPIIISLAVIVFIWGVFKYVTVTDSDKKEEARSLMIYGIIAIFVMVSVWGLVNILTQTFFGGSQVTPPQVPRLPSGYNI